MAHVSELPCNGDGICMVCKKKPTPEETITCTTCATPWHVTCLSSSRPESLADALHWECPDCSMTNPPFAGKSGGSDDLVAAIREIEMDESLTDVEKAKRRQELLSGAPNDRDGDGNGNHEENEINGGNDVLNLIDGSLTCPICTQSLDRPVTTPCGHNFCLKCFKKWTEQQKQERTRKKFKLTCASCRREIPETMASQPRINPALVTAIRMAKMSKSSGAGGPPKVYHFVHNQNRPDKAYTTERAKKAGKANACSGKIFVTVPLDHFGPITEEHDPLRNQGVLVGESWEGRMECRQWGAHFPHVAGICGQSSYGAQSVALSGGYEDDEDHGEWFLYTGSGGRDLSGNKRTNKLHSSDQKFEKFNEALRVSCRKGYPVRVVRSHKEKRSSYAPEIGVRYDGIYRIEKCWRKNGKQGYKVCRYLFVRCDNDPAPWTSDNHGDRPRPLPVIKELEDAVDITQRKGSSSWDYDEDKGCWMWKKPPPPSRKVDSGNPEDGKQQRKVKRQGKNMSVREKLLKEFSCQICQMVMINPLTTPCAHNFCKACLEGAFAGQSYLRQRNEGRRTLRVQKNVMKCPSCSHDIADFLQNPQVNRELMGVIESLQRKTVEEISEQSSQETNDTHEKSDAVAGDTEIYNADDQSVEELEDSIIKPQTEAKLHQTCIVTLPKQPAAGTAENGVGPVITEVADSREPQATVVECKFKQTYKRKNADNDGSLAMEHSGVMTRNKRANME